MSVLEPVRYYDRTVFSFGSSLKRVVDSVVGEATALRLFSVVAVPLFALYLATANWVMPYNIDALTNTLLAWEIADEGDVFLEDHEILAAPEFQGFAAWVVSAGESVTAQYPPGTALHLVPAYLVLPGSETIEHFESGLSAASPRLPVPPLYPAAVVAALISSVAMGTLALVFRRLVPARMAVLGAYVAGLGTGVWSVAADSLWQHGPAMLWIVVGVAFAASFPTVAGLSFGVAILIRVHTGVIAAALGLWQSWKQRSFRPALTIGVASALGLVATIVYNRLVFGAFSITAGYSDAISSRLSDTDLADYAGNVVLALVDPARGLLVFSPFLILLLPGLRAAWRTAPDWVQGSALGGALYLLVQLKANRYSGGEGFWGYRYPLEALIAAAPLLLLAYAEWAQWRSERYRRALAALIVASIAITAFGAVYFSSFWAGPSG